LLCGGLSIPATFPCISSVPSADGGLLPYSPSAYHSGCINIALATATKPDRTIEEGVQKGEKKQTKLRK